MTDPNIVKYMDEHYIKTGEIKVKDIRDYGEYTVAIPVYNSSAEFAKKAVAVFHLNFTREGENVLLHDFPAHLLTVEDCVTIKRAIADYLYEKELPSHTLREALLNRQQNPYDKQNVYFAWKKPDDTFFMIGMESYQINHILTYEYDTYFKDYNTKLYNIDPHAKHLRGPHLFNPLEELVSKTSKFDFLGSWTDPDLFMDSKDGKVAACGRWELAIAYICGRKAKEPLDLMISSAKALNIQNDGVHKEFVNNTIER